MNVPPITARPKQTAFPIDFLIIGGGISGLACAIGLRRVGHRVLVLEKDTEDEQFSGGCRVPPNLTKILCHWGLEDELQRISETSEGIKFFVYETGEFLGTHIWSRELLEETRGTCQCTHHADLRMMLYNAAISHGAKIRRGACVTDIDAEKRLVTLADGEVLHPDVIVGADGYNGVSRALLLKEELAEDEEDDEEDKQNNVEIPTGLMMFNTAVPKNLMMDDPELRYFYEQDQVSMFVWFGSGRSVIGFPMGKEAEFAMNIYGPDERPNTTWNDKLTVSKLCSSIGHPEVDSRLMKLAELAIPPACLSVMNASPLRSWVHDSGRMVLIGAAANYVLPGAFHACAIGVEDAAVLAKIFSHLLREDQIPTFLYAFQDLRQKRLAMFKRNDMNNIMYMNLPKCELQSQRDHDMRTNELKGKNVLEMGQSMEFWEELKDIFTYDCEDEADNWWVSWGLLKERADGHGISDATQSLHFSVLSIQTPQWPT